MQPEQIIVPQGIYSGTVVQVKPFIPTARPDHTCINIVIATDHLPKLYYKLFGLGWTIGNAERTLGVDPFGYNLRDYIAKLNSELVNQPILFNLTYKEGFGNVLYPHVRHFARVGES